MTTPIPLSEDALNRFRITHSDRDLRPLLRRIHRLPHLPRLKVEIPGLEGIGEGDEEREEREEGKREREMTRLELLKWRGWVERVMASVGNLERQRAGYQARGEGILNRAEELRSTLGEEKELLKIRLEERDWEVRCDEVATRITARGKTRKELDELIAEMERSLEDHRASHQLYLTTTQSRIDTFNQITKLVDECKALKLPIEPQATMADEEEDGKMDVDEPLSPPSSVDPTSASTRLNAAALPFQPSTSSSTSQSTAAGPSGRSQTPPISRPHSSHTHHHSSSHTHHSTLPARPSRAPSSRAPVGPSSSLRVSSGIGTLPNRPSSLRSVTTPASGAGGLAGGSLEDGEVGEEEGEVSDPRRRR